MHPVSLTRDFRRHLGETISDRIQRRRVEHAAALLRGPGALATLAIRSGFSDHAHLCRVFKGRIASALSPPDWHRSDRSAFEAARELGRMVFICVEHFD